MRIFKAGIAYFLIVFGAGFALAFIRLPVLVPHFGVRTAELLEAPVMLAIIAWASRRLVRRNPELRRSACLFAGLIAFVLFVAAELLVAYFLGARTLGEYIASREPISGSVYLASLVFFAVAPALWSSGPGPNNSFKPKPHRGGA